jgi:hypothetical protein
MASTRRTVALGAEAQRPDLLLHALAQLPAGRALEIAADHPQRAQLEMIARAYGILDRLAFSSSPAQAVDDPIPSRMADLVEGMTDASDPPSETQRDDEMLAAQRVALVTNVPAPYRIPLFNTMARRLAGVGAEFRVFFQALGSSSRPWIGSGGAMDFDHEVIRSFEVPIGFRNPRLPVRIKRPLAAFSPTVVLCGSLSPLVAPRVARAAQSCGAAFGIWSGEVGWRPTAAGRHRRRLRQRIVNQADFGVAYGHQAGEYLRGLREDLPLVYGRNSSAAYASGRVRPRRPDVVELLTVADMAVPGKGVGTLIDAVRDRPRLPCRLTIVGGGGSAETAIKEHAQGDRRIRFLGAMPQPRVQERYAESDVYLFPSQIDIFGLALVEAMGSGLAPVTSTRPGAASDLAVHERNCLAVSQHDRATWAAAIERVVIDHDLRIALGAAAKRTIERRWTIEHACEGMLAGLRLGLLASGRRQP